MQGFQNGYALIIGISNYPLVRSLPLSVLNDAKDIYDLFRHPNSCGYLEDNIKLLLDEKATKEGVYSGLQWLLESASSNSTVLFYYSGHGGRVEANGISNNYLIPYECDPYKLTDTAFSGSELFSLLNEIQSHRFIAVFDCCYSAGLDEKTIQQNTIFKSGFDISYYEELSQGMGRVVIASSLSDETSLVLNGMRNSLFTHYFLEALRGDANHRGDGLIRIFDLFDYVSENVPKKGRQHPVFKTSDLRNNFPVALYKGGEKASPKPTMQSSINMVEIREKMVKAFTTDELKDLCQDLQQIFNDENINININLDVLDGDNKVSKIRELIEYLNRRNSLSYLVSATRRVRPGIF